MNWCEGKPRVCIAETVKWGVTSELYFVFCCYTQQSCSDCLRTVKCISQFNYEGYNSGLCVRCYECWWSNIGPRASATARRWKRGNTNVLIQVERTSTVHAQKQKIIETGSDPIRHRLHLWSAIRTGDASFSRDGCWQCHNCNCQYDHHNSGFTSSEAYKFHDRQQRCCIEPQTAPWGPSTKYDSPQYIVRLTGTNLDGESHLINDYFVTFLSKNLIIIICFQMHSIIRCKGTRIIIPVVDTAHKTLWYFTTYSISCRGYECVEYTSSPSYVLMV